MMRIRTILLGIGILALALLAWQRFAKDASLPRSALAAPPQPSGPRAFVGVETSGAPPDFLGNENVPTKWEPREPGEWDGMPVNADAQQICDVSASCGLARSCKAGKCTSCVADADCVAGEGCVLQHCVKAELIGCRSFRDCPTKALCVLSGYSSLPRGNEGMKSYCNSSEGGSSPGIAPHEPPARDTRTVLPGDDLLKAARDVLR
jgi:hypothetical protein